MMESFLAECARNAASRISRMIRITVMMHTAMKGNSYFRIPRIPLFFAHKNTGQDNKEPQAIVVKSVPRM